VLLFLFVVVEFVWCESVGCMNASCGIHVLFVCANSFSARPLVGIAILFLIVDCSVSSLLDALDCDLELMSSVLTVNSTERCDEIDLVCYSYFMLSR